MEERVNKNLKNCVDYNLPRFEKRKKNQGRLRGDLKVCSFYFF